MLMLIDKSTPSVKDTVIHIFALCFSLGSNLAVFLFQRKTYYQSAAKSFKNQNIHGSVRIFLKSTIDYLKNVLK